jgi:hypothetical protein
MRRKLARADIRVAELASRQHGVVAVRQLRDAGLSDRELQERARKGRLHRIHQGVYAVGHTGLPETGRWMAAVLAGELLGREAFLSHSSAAALWGLLPTATPIEIVVRGYAGKARRRGVRLHRSQILDEVHTDVRLGIPVTTPARTIFDLQRAPRRWRIAPSQLRRAIRQAAVLGYAVGADGGWDGTRSELESLFLALCGRFGLPLPELNAMVGLLEVDFLWREQGLVVETDGFQFHRGRATFADDRRRDLQLRSDGFEVLRLTYDQVTKDGRQVATILRDRLSSPP